MADEEDCPAAPGKASHLAQAFLLKGCVANCQYLIDDQDFRLKVGGYRKSQPDIHAGGVAFDGGIEKFFDSREVDDLVKFANDLRARHAQDCAIKKDVFAPREFLMKPVPTSRRLAIRAVDADSALSRNGDPAQEFQ